MTNVNLNYKKCSVCKTEKEIFCFNKCSSAKYGYSPRCKTCHNKMNREIQKTRIYTPDQIAKKRAYRKNYVVDPDSRKKSTEKYNKKIRGTRKEYNAQWKKNNAARVLANTRKRQTTLISACPSWADHEKIKIIYAVSKFLNNNCIYGLKYHVDHIIPLRGKNVCGLHVHNNLQILEATENLRKHTKWQ